MKSLTKKLKNNFDDACCPSCPVRKTLEILDGKWTILVLRDLLSGTKRFGELKRSLGDLNPKTLTDRLRQLEKAKIVSKKVYAEIPPRVEYSLTKKGLALKSVVEALAKWGSDWI